MALCKKGEAGPCPEELPIAPSRPTDGSGSGSRPNRAKGASSNARPSKRAHGGRDPLATPTSPFASPGLDKKVFVFPNTSADAYVLLKPTLEQPLRQFTICLQYFTDSTAQVSLFSAASRKHDNEILLFKMSPTVYEICVGNEALIYTVPRLPERTAYWESVCVMWDSETGVVQFWLDGQPLPRKGLAKGYEIPTELVMVLGQDQDSFGGSFDARQSLVGEMAQVYMWDTVLPPEQLRKTWKEAAPEPLVDWMALNFDIKGYVVVEPSLV